MSNIQFNTGAKQIYSDLARDLALAGLQKVQQARVAQTGLASQTVLFSQVDQKPFSGLINLFSSLGSLSDLIGERVAQDKAAGFGLFEGATTFSENVQYVGSLIEQFETLRALGQNGFDASFDNLGSIAQEYLMGRLEKQAFQYLGSELGINAGDLGFGEIAEEGFGFIAEKLGVPKEFLGSDLAQTISGEVNELFPGLAKLELGAKFNKFLGAAGAAYAGYQVIQGWGKGSPVEGGINGATAGAYVGSAILPGIGTVIGGAIGGIVGVVGGLVKVGKHPDQKARDSVRALMREQGIINDKWQLKLADGSFFDIGRDGGAKLQNKDGSKRPMYNTDASNPLTPQVIGLANPLAMILTGGDPKLSSDFAGYFTNAALSNTDSLEGARHNMLAIFKSFNITPQVVFQSLTQMAQTGRISSQEYQAYVNGFNSLLAHEKPSPNL